MNNNTLPSCVRCNMYGLPDEFETYFEHSLECQAVRTKYIGSKVEERHLKFLELSKQMEELQVKVEITRELLEEEMRNLNFGYMFQDPTSGVVYKIISPGGKYVHYADMDYVRTALEGERSGTLSKKEATEAGFVLVKS